MGNCSTLPVDEEDNGVCPLTLYRQLTTDDIDMSLPSSVLYENVTKKLNDVIHVSIILLRHSWFTLALSYWFTLIFILNLIKILIKYVN